MKKIKLFLLTGIVSILSIGCFTNSQFISEESISLSWDNKVFSPGVINLPVSIDNINFSLVDGSDSCVIIFTKGSYKCKGYFNYYAGSPVTVSQCKSANAVNIIGDVSVSYGNNGDCGNGGILLSYVKESDKMPVSALTPAINGLHDTVREIIPYIVYIGIGVLLAILGFYAVRWLVNRIARKINSVFRSKRS